MFSQIMITLTSLCSVVLVQYQDQKIRRYACLFALAGEPFWLYTGWQAQQWGIVFCTGMYTAVWLVGFYKAWLA